MVPLQEAYIYFNAYIESGVSVNSEAYLDDGATGLFKNVILYDSQSGTELQNLRSFNVFQSAVHKMRDAEWSNSVGKALYGVEGKAFYLTGAGTTPATDAAFAQSHQLASHRKAIAEETGTHYAINYSDFLSADRPYPIQQQTTIRMDAQVELDGISTTLVGTTGTSTPVAVIKKNPLNIYNNLDVDVATSNGYAIRYYGYVHHQKVLVSGESSHVFSLNNGNLASVQGILVVLRNNDTSDIYGKHLSKFEGVEQVKTLQLRLNGVLYPQLPMQVSEGDGTAALNIAETASKMQHLARLLSRGSAYPIPDTTASMGSWRDESANAMIWVPLSDSQASWGSGVSLLNSTVELDFKTQSITGGSKSADIFVIYDKMVSWENGVPQVDFLRGQTIN